MGNNMNIMLSNMIIMLHSMNIMLWWAWLKQKKIIIFIFRQKKSRTVDIYKLKNWKNIRDHLFLSSWFADCENNLKI